MVDSGHDKTCQVWQVKIPQPSEVFWKTFLLPVPDHSTSSKRGKDLFVMPLSTNDASGHAPKLQSGITFRSYPADCAYFWIYAPTQKCFYILFIRVYTALAFGASVCGELDLRNTL